MARAGEKILLAAYGDGAGVFLLETTQRIAGFRQQPGLARRGLVHNLGGPGAVACVVVLAS